MDGIKNFLYFYRDEIHKANNNDHFISLFTGAYGIALQ